MNIPKGLLKNTGFLMQTLRNIGNQNPSKGLVLGAYCKEATGQVKLTPVAQYFDKQVSGKLQHYLEIVKCSLKPGGSKVLYDISPEFPALALVGLPLETTGYNELEDIDEMKEAIRVAASTGCRKLQKNGVTEISVESFEDAEASAEGSILGVWKFQEYKNKDKIVYVPEIKLFQESKCAKQTQAFQTGQVKAFAQNTSRKLSDMPANKMTPTIFAEEVKKMGLEVGVEVIAHDKAWIEGKGMGSFLSVAKGSVEPPVFLEIRYSGRKDGGKPIVLIGKGITFDSGGISLKAPADMDVMRADMSGGACVASTIMALAKLKVPLNVTGLIPLTENLPSGSASKPGDVVTAMNGKTIQIDNTDAEGRLVLADALCYADTLNPEFTLDIATLTGAMGVAVGGAATGVFSNSTPLWNELRKAGVYTGDRMWRFPLWNYFTKIMTDFPAVDVNNLSKVKGGGACTAAAFLREFSPSGSWLHLDMAGVMGPCDETPYLHKGMTGRPTRTLIHFLSEIAKKQS